MLELVCPTDRTPVHQAKQWSMQCELGHLFEVDPFSAAPRLFDEEYGRPFHADSWDPLDRRPEDYPHLGANDIDEYVANQVAATNGYLYRGVTLATYPIPIFPIAREEGTLVDVGCGWGRWSIAGARAGWSVTSVDPWRENCQAFARVAHQLAIAEQIQIVNGDGRRLPFADDVAAAAFSYSVLQHLPKPEARDALREMVRVVQPGGRVLVQMPNVAGFRQRQLQRRGVVADSAFNVRPWTFGELQSLADDLASQWSIFADGFFSLNAQWSERHVMPARSRLIVAASEAARQLSRVLKPLVRVADSVWLLLVVDQ